jgi:ATP-dependent RNA helicase DHX37/DHR1
MLMRGANATMAPHVQVYVELLATEKRPYMLGATALEPAWLSYHAPNMCDFSNPLADPPPWYDRDRDAVLACQAVSYRPYLTQPYTEH